MSRYEEADLSRVRSYPVGERKSLVAEEQLYRAPQDLDSFSEFFDSLPDVLAARSLRELLARVRAARERGAGFLVLAGAHVIKTGLSPAIVRLMEEGWVTALALNGAGAIHDLEMAFFGETSEDVAAALPEGRFGMARETSEWLNRWTVDAAKRDEGLGEGLGHRFIEEGAPGLDRSLLAAGYRLGIPVTVHLSIGTDINQQHASFSGAAAGETSARDFRILTASVRELAEGVALNVGSAVLLPEVFLKAVSVATNLGTEFRDLTTAVFDFARHYRPEQNVMQRPTQGRGRGYYIVGHHELLVPLFTHALLRFGRPQSRTSSGKKDES